MSHFRQEAKKQQSASSSSALSVRSQLDDVSSIRNDPLKNFSKSGSSQPAAPGHVKPPLQRSKQQHTTTSKPELSQAESQAAGPEETDKLKLGYDRTLIFVDGEEFSFEEVRSIACSLSYFASCTNDLIVDPSCSICVL